MSRKKVIICFAIVFVVLMSVMIFRFSTEERLLWATFVTKTDRELIEESELIITGKVIKQTEIKPNIIRGPYAHPDIDYLIKIDEILAGEHDKEMVTVRTENGYDLKTNTRYIAFGYVEFSRGERVVLFLTRDKGYDATDEDYYVTIGGMQGKYILHKDGSLEMPFGEADFTELDELKKAIEQ